MSSSVYIHVPFCLSRCRYCAFYSGEPLDHLGSYASLVRDEILLRSRNSAQPGPLSSVYFGGGTPSLLGPEGVGPIVDQLDRCWGVRTGAEVSLEVNPAGDVDFGGFLAAGVTRVSVGVQSLKDEVLAGLGRRHSAFEARKTVAEAARAGFESVNADLLYSIPGLDPGEISGCARDLISLGVQHLSAYSLEVHPGTVLASEGFQPAGPEEEERQWMSLREVLDRSAFEVYEVSNFAAPGRRCRHNLSYWNRAGYIGLGPGAHGFDPRQGEWGSRSWNATGLESYRRNLAASVFPEGGCETPNRDEALLEVLFLSLRRADPVDLEALVQAFSLNPEVLNEVVRALQGEGYVQPGTGKRFTPTPEGLRRADGLAIWAHTRLLAKESGAIGPESMGIQEKRPEAERRGRSASTDGSS